MPEYSESFVLEVFSSAFASENLFLERLGGSKSDPDTIRRYLSLPISSRPSVSFFFDRELYWLLYPGIKDLDIDPLVHFMHWGAGERRVPHPMIDIDHMLMAEPGLFSEDVTIDTLFDVLSRDVVDPSPYFSIEFYRRQLDGSEAVEGGLLRHFLETGLLRGFKPNPALDPLAYYRGSSEKTFDVRSALRQLVLPNAAPWATTNDPTSEQQAKAMFRSKAEAVQMFAGRNPLRFEFSGRPDVSVIVIVHDNFALTLLALASLRANYPGPIELILIDSGSTDETVQLKQYVSGACLLRFESNVSFVRGCNAALEVVSAETVLYLNNDVELAPGAVTAALSRLHSDPTIGAVGGKVIRTHGLLQEAGCIIWQDGWTIGYQRGQSPTIAEANFVRDVDFCSAVFLLARTPLLKDLGGFDDDFAPAYFEDTDLCLRIREAGFRIVYDPAVTVHHLEYGTSQGASAAEQRMQEAHKVFVQKHAEHLRLAPASNTRAQLFARSVNVPRRRVLLIEDWLPLRRLGSGFVRSNDIVSAMAALGYAVTVFPIHSNDQNLAAVYADFPDTVEIIHDRYLVDLEQFLKLRRGYYDTIWITRTHNLDLLKPILQRCGNEVLDKVRLVLDTEAICAIRDGQFHALTSEGAPFDLGRAIEAELRSADFCHSVVAVNAAEGDVMRSLGLRNIKVLGHLRSVELTPRGWTERAGMLFVGAIHTNDSPNYDSLVWFVDQVLPLIERDLGYETRLTIAGFVAEKVDMTRFSGHARITLRGAIADLTPLYDRHRVFVAPTRYAAGLPYNTSSPRH